MRLIMIRNKDNERLPQNYCDFKVPGGTIGRGTDNTLILPDQTRAISRLQAVVHISPTGETAITHRGSTTPLLLNGDELAHNVQQPLTEGDILDIGGYQFSVSLQQPANPLPPTFRVTSSSTGINEAIWEQLEAEFRSPTLSPKPPTVQDPDHPLLVGGQDNRTSKDPLAMPEETELASLQDKSANPDRLFEQDDPFSQPTIMKDTTPSVLFMNAKWAAKQEEQRESLPQLTPLPAPGAFSLAEEFSGEWEFNTSNIADDNDDDPVGLVLNNAVPLTSALEGLDTFTADIPSWPTEPQSLAATDIAPQEQPAPSIEEHHQPPQQDLVGMEPPEIPGEPLAFADHELLRPESQEQREDKPDSLPPQRTRMGIDPVRHQPFKPAKSTSQEQLHGELFSAFVAGLGLDDAPVAPDFSPEQLYLAGKLLSLFSQGTVALLSSRSILKRGLKAEMTMILEEENNPFKMLPSGKTVLMQIFSTPMPGFTPPESAVRDAMIDLQAHQLGMIAGVRAIIAAMLQTFHPDTLEKKVAEQGHSKGLFSGNRKAMLWDMLKIQYQQVANEVEDDFHTLFGEAFLYAYDLEIRQYKAAQNRKDQQ
ncbi:type VI secretion system-associated FHA domain protein TagH [Serratia sp. L9]|uniref:type VI secretion system-associated FHA domain protein TagH n=1 Tax=Serratia sp. L9 TaxID=3423946 RepID=UPI003D675443